jgi:hypothetical protein
MVPTREGIPPSDFRGNPMALFRYFADQADGSTLAFKRADYDRGANKLPRCWDEATRSWVRATRVVIRKNNPSMHECDARCMNATGRTMQCECSCMGRNHGKGVRMTCAAT